MRAAAAIPTAGLLAGSASGLLLSEWPLAVPLLLLALGAVSVGVAARLDWPAMLASSVGLTFFAGGFALAIDAWEAAWRPTLRAAFEARASEGRDGADGGVSVMATGVLRLDASPRPAGGVSLSLDVRSIEESRDPSGPDVRHVEGGVFLTVAGTLAAGRIGDWRAGRTVRAPVRLRRPARYLNPGVADDERALARRGTTLVGSIKSGALVEVVRNGPWPAEAAAHARAFVRRAVATGVEPWSRRSAGIVTAILIGDRAGLDDDVERRLQEAGTYHVIAISGGNVAVIAGLVLGAFRMAGLLGRAAMLGVVATLVAYGYLVSGGASVSRATLMAVVYFSARAIDLRGPPLHVLALAAALLVAAQPLAIVDPGFLLTFGATAAILLVMRAWPRPALRRPLPMLGAMLAASAAAEVALLPVSAHQFSRVTFAGLGLNFVAVPLMAVVQVAGLLVVASAWSAELAAAAGWVAHVAAEGLVRSADLVTVAPGLTWRVPAPEWPAIAAYYLGVVAGWTLWRRRIAARDRSLQPVVTRARDERGVEQGPLARGRVADAARLTAFVTAVAAGIWIVAAPWTAWQSAREGRLRVTFIDVGQGDAALIRFPGGDTMLVDAGGLPGASSFDVGERVVAPVARLAGVRRLGTLALTHGDGDHAGGAAAIVREFRPRDVWEGVPVPPLAVLGDIRAAADRAGARWANVQAGDLVTIDGVLVAVRHPPPPDWERREVRNDDSVVLELSWRDVSIVLSGDIGRDVEQTIAARFAPSPLRVVKVPHHGSRSSSSPAFLRTLAAQVAVVSVGRGNPFGHPAPAVLDAYRLAGTRLFRTDRHGAVVVDTDGHSMEVSTFTGERLSVTRAGRDR